MDYTEKVIICKDCGDSFTLSIGEQKFYEKKGLSLPIRCKKCRDAKKSKEPKEKVITEEKKESKGMTPEEIDAILKKWRENTIPFADAEWYYENRSSTNRRKK